MVEPPPVRLGANAIRSVGLHFFAAAEWDGDYNNELGGLAEIAGTLEMLVGHLCRALK
jgi:hypothetical protein